MRLSLFARLGANEWDDQVSAIDPNQDGATNAPNSWPRADILFDASEWDHGHRKYDGKSQQSLRLAMTLSEHERFHHERG
jgi:hypothetical protein